MIPAMVADVPFMSAKLVTATAWDDLNGPSCEISDLTLFQRDISEEILFDSIANSATASSDMNIIATLTLLSFEVRSLLPLFLSMALLICDSLSMAIMRHIFSISTNL
jgi:hypothetical protein